MKKKPRGQHGGARRGSGQKPGTTQQRTVEKQRSLDLWRERVEAQLDPLITAQLEIAKGAYEFYVKVPEVGWVRLTEPDAILQALNSGEENYRIQCKEPDRLMLKDIMDRLTGKPKEQLEVTGAGGGPLRHEVRFVDVAGPAL